MDEEFLLLNPGPVPLSRDVRDVMSEPMVSHRSADFEETYARLQDGLRYVFERSSPTGEPTAAGGTPLALMGTATLGMEAAIASLTTEDSRVVTLENGKFGRRFSRIARRYASVDTVTAEWGESPDIEEVRAAVDDRTDVVAMVHNETSTGLLNPVAEVGEIAAEHDARFVVDGVTSIGGDAFYLDEWGVDIAVTDAQKALAAPPGLSAIYIADGAEGHLDSGGPPFYADLEWYSRKARDHQTPFTSAVPLVRGMGVAVEEIEAEGMPDRIARHRRQARAIRAAVDAMGLELFPTVKPPTRVSNTVTATSLPTTVEADEFFAGMDARNVSIAGGQGPLDGDIFRVSNMGNLSAEDIRRGVGAIAGALNDASHGVDKDAALAAADAELAP